MAERTPAPPSQKRKAPSPERTHTSTKRTRTSAAASSSAQPAAPPGPTYYDLVKEAIIALKDRHGSTKEEIAKYVAERKEGFAVHYLNNALRNAVKNGKLIQVKGAFKLSPEERKPAERMPAKHPRRQSKATPRGSSSSKPSARSSTSGASSSRRAARPA